MKFLDFFAGIGGFRTGLELAGHECVGFCEFDKFATASYTSMHLITDEQREQLAQLDFKKRQKEILKDEYRNGEWYANDVRTINANNLPNADLWTFGFPCQDISVAGNQLGFTGHRSSLFFAVTKLIRELEEESKPSHLLIENVKNLLSVNGGFDYAKLLVELDEIGYDAEWQVLNSSNFGVPQNRERVFIVGHLRGRGGREVFPVARSCGAVGIEVIGTTAPPQRKIGQRDLVYSGDGVMGCLNATDYKQPKQIAIPVLTPDRVEKRQNGRRFKEDGEPMFTLTTQDRHGVMIKDKGAELLEMLPDNKKIPGTVGHHPFSKKIEFSGWYSEVTPYLLATDFKSPKTTLTENMRIRKLTPKECFRLQGFADELFEKAQFVNSDSQLYKQAGNSVTVNVIYEIAKRLEDNACKN